MKSVRRARTFEPRERGLRLRRGSITVFVLVCLVAITMVCGVLLRIGLAERQRIRAEARRLQAEWLVESGLERAVVQINESKGEYQGEVWEITAAELGGLDSGRVTIAVETPKDEAGGRRRVRVQADYPHDATARVRLSKMLTVAIKSASSSEKP
ncbi:hypothetical protein [Singulisphaera acidiphila]|uniref:Uncharacterized protein n=1 Tax=Singulisphaera acidiphila (strain ATCC BAA-1392 / DSM 18658 / VKM B-2454 / MOB10) TaxID=886293 RepID=L0DP60_SINAD|nr:hypothetical protein [Singulisphaera acidiphila]AGA30456.1 hypothetical protein Sinac_6376 [Singulisphaera acidiphila DSM 18658]